MVVSSISLQKIEKNINDYRGSTMLVCVGNATGDSDSGPWILLSKGTRVESKPLRNLVEAMSCPEFYFVHPTSLAYMTNKACI